MNAPWGPSNLAVLCSMYAIGVACTAYAVWAWRHRVSAARDDRWSVTSGEILSSEIVVHPGHDDDDYEPCVRFAYRVAGQRLQGDRLRVGPKMMFPDRTKAEAAVASYRKGDRVQVHYDRDRPERSVLERVPTPSGLATWLMSGLFILGCAAFVTVTLLLPEGIPGIG